MLLYRLKASLPYEMNQVKDYILKEYNVAYALTLILAYYLIFHIDNLALDDSFMKLRIISQTGIRNKQTFHQNFSYQEFLLKNISFFRSFVKLFFLHGWMI